MALSGLLEIELTRPHREARFAAANEAARNEMMREDGQRSLGENLEQADALIRAAFELSAGMRSARP